MSRFGWDNINIFEFMVESHIINSNYTFMVMCKSFVEGNILENTKANECKLHISRSLYVILEQRYNFKLPQFTN